MFNKLYFYVLCYFWGFICAVSKKNPPWGKTCPYENKTVTELNIEANYTGDDVND